MGEVINRRKKNTFTLKILECKSTKDFWRYYPLQNEVDIILLNVHKNNNIFKYKEIYLGAKVWKLETVLSVKKYFNI